MASLDDLRLKHPEIRADYTIDQHWESYGAAEHGVWKTLYERQAKVLPGRACDEWLSGLKALGWKPRAFRIWSGCRTGSRS